MNEVTLPWPPKATGRWNAPDDAYLMANYLTREHSDIGTSLGRTERAVRNRCWRLGLVDHGNRWSDDDIAALVSAYSCAVVGADINLDALAAKIGKHKTNVCRKARTLGLTDIGRAMISPENRKVRRPKFSSAEEVAAHISAVQKALIAKRGHPRYMKGKHHTNQAKAAIGRASERSNALRTKEQKAEYLMKAMKTKVRNGTYAQERPNASWKAGWREIGGTRKYYRSKWEANYAYYLEWLRQIGQIEAWLHEPVTFWFEGVKRGSVSYLPDFWVKEKNGAEAYHEVKGWMDDRSKTKIRRMAKYHPKVKLIVIDSKGYAALKKSVDRLVPGWEA